MQCGTADLECVYNKSRKRRNTAGTGEAPSKGTSVLPDRAKSSSTKPVITTASDPLAHIMARIASLERDANMFKNRVASIERTPSGSSPDIDDESSPRSTSSATSLPSVEGRKSANAVLEIIKKLNNIVSPQEQGQADIIGSHGDIEIAAQEPFTWKSLPHFREKDLRTLAKETASIDAVALRRSVDMFFEVLNPHYPCLDEGHFRSQLDDFYNDKHQEDFNGDYYQFIAMLNLIHAEVKVLDENWSTSACAPAWEEFCRAENILNNLTWLGNGTISTLQCLVLKARYLLYIEKGDSAYDTMGRAVRLVFQLGLHDQNSWKDSTPVDFAMRQKTFWSVLYLERNVALNCGSPYLLRDSDFNVELPGNLDDEITTANAPLLPLSPDRSCNAYIVTVAKWCRLTAEIWDSLFSINARKADCEEYIVSMDARIMLLRSQVAPHLRWDEYNVLDGDLAVAPFLLRQALILYLVSLPTPIDRA